MAAPVGLNRIFRDTLRKKLCYIWFPMYVSEMRFFSYQGGLITQENIIQKKKGPNINKVPHLPAHVVNAGSFQVYFPITWL